MSKPPDPGRYHPDGTPKIPSQMCLECGLVMNAATPAPPWTEDDGMPEPGDVAICLNCGVATLYDADLKFRKPTAEELADPAFQRIQAAGRRACAMHRIGSLLPTQRRGRA